MERDNSLAVFHGHGNHPLDFLLKPGFKHTFAAIETEGGWIRIDGMAGVAIVEWVAPKGFPLEKFYWLNGFTVVPVKGGEASYAPYAWNNCVGLVKGILGIRSWAMTPWQLYRKVRKDASTRRINIQPAETVSAANGEA